jgi:hypothetical protein
MNMKTKWKLLMIHRIYFGLLVLLVSTLSCTKVDGQVISELFLSLYFSDPATLKTPHDIALLTDGRYISVARGKIKAPASIVYTSWNDFHTAAILPPPSNIKLQFRNEYQSVKMCLNEDCARVEHICPARSDASKNLKCIAVKNITDLQKVK